MAVINQLNEITYELITNEQGIVSLPTQKIIGELRAIIFKISEVDSLQGFKMSIALGDIELLNEDIIKDSFYVLKTQSRDGFGQYCADSEYYLLNDELTIIAQGKPFSSIECTLRWV